MRDPRRVQAFLFDFNGTLSDDERVQCEIYRELFAEHGKPLTEEEYFADLAGFWTPRSSRGGSGRTIRRPGRSSRAACGSSSNGSATARRFPRTCARPCSPSTDALASPWCQELRASRSRRSRARREVDVFDLIVSAESVTRGKPDPEGYLRALELLGVPSGEAVAIEDAPPGVAAAKAAGVYCVAVLGTVPVERLAEADEIAPRVDAALVERFLS